MVSDKVVLAIHRSFAKSTHTQQGSFDQFKKNPKRTTTTRNINGTEWIFSTEEFEPNLKSKTWTVISYKNNAEYIVTANVPIAELSKHQGEVVKMLESIALK